MGLKLQNQVCLGMKSRLEKYDAFKEKVNGQGNSRVFFNGFPSLVHFVTPVNIVENNHRIVV